MKHALIGYSGFVGSTLCKQTTFGQLYRSNNIHEIDSQEFDIVVCAGAPAQKWIANREPDADKQKIDSLISHLGNIKCKNFILISTVDVFENPINVDENTAVNENNLHPYGLHRRFLEKFVAKNFANHLIIRLPGLIGPGLRKNIIFDFLNENNLENIDSRGVFQFYPMVNLWADIQTAISENLQLVHLTAAPISVADVCREGFGKSFEQEFAKSPARYDMKTCHAGKFGIEGFYQYSVRETLQAIRHYAQAEPKTLKTE